MAVKLMESAQARWRAVNAPHLFALVRAGATFQKGKLVERGDTGDRTSTEKAAALAPRPEATYTTSNYGCPTSTEPPAAGDGY